MRALVVADVHANLEAFEAVVAAANDSGGFDEIWCLGDLVGYGADPAACIELLHSFRHVTIAGNHDLAAAGALSLDGFNPYARAAAEWTATQLDEASREWIRSLPSTAIEGEVTLAHGTLDDPVWEYLSGASEATRHLSMQQTAYGLVGHTHVPLVFIERAGGPRVLRPRDGESIDLDGTRFVANPGSTGQPRDGDPRAAFALVDTESRRLSFHRANYDIARAAGKIRAAGLPAVLADRLSRGR